MWSMNVLVYVHVYVFVYLYVFVYVHAYTNIYMHLYQLKNSHIWEGSMEVAGRGRDGRVDVDSVLMYEILKKKIAAGW